MGMGVGQVWILLIVDFFFFVGFYLLVCWFFYIKRRKGATVAGIKITHLHNFPDTTNF